MTNENTNGDLISREELKEEFRNNCFHNCYYCKLAKWDKKGACYICGLLDNAPSVEIATELQPNCNNLQQKEDCGDWIKHEDFNDSIKYGCNQCGNLANVPSNFCPNCGKRMFFGKRINLTGARNVK